ncbi:MAG: hypothetical protein IPH96_13045 [Saprospiraceae bacterium]|nr:hypothetical protein [Saprospiraceae bacterium]
MQLITTQDTTKPVIVCPGSYINCDATQVLSNGVATQRTIVILLRV